MSGDDNANGTSYAHEAGIIPRVLFRIFHELGARGWDHSVSCSFVELFNEEFRDLLDDSDKKLRLADDPTNKTAYLRGLTEHHITSAMTGLGALQRGLQRRQVAATKMNDHSSRSHAIFTINVHIDVDGTGDQIRRAKINLVDLAGSENVGKSGAVKQRAREAGMINQSLLALGRVINALVDGNVQHIPYRESNLTRLLRDSLGGRTKTCMIATVSPAQVNVEETMSTLEYASRTKSIKTRPQANITISKAALLEDFSHDMEKLQKDLSATQLKNGIYLDPSNYDELKKEIESRRVQVNDYSRRIETMESQLRSTRETLESTRQDLQARVQEFLTTKKDLSSVQEQLAESQRENANLRQLLADKSQECEALSAKEKELTNEVRVAHDQLDSKTREMQLLIARLNHKNGIRLQARTMIAKATKDLEKLPGQLDHKLGNINQYVSKIQANSDSVKLLMEDLSGLISDKLGEIQAASDASRGGVSKSIGDVAKQLEQSEACLRGQISKIADALSLQDRAVHSVQEQLSEMHGGLSRDGQDAKDILASLSGDMDALLDLRKQGLDAIVRSMQQGTTESAENVTASTDRVRKALEALERQERQEQQELIAVIQKYANGRRERYAAVAQDLEPIDIATGNWRSTAFAQLDALAEHNNREKDLLKSVSEGVSRSQSAVGNLSATVGATTDKCAAALRDAISGSREASNEASNGAIGALSRELASARERIHELQAHVVSGDRQVSAGVDSAIEQVSQKFSLAQATLSVDAEPWQQLVSSMRGGLGEMQTSISELRCIPSEALGDNTPQRQQEASRAPSMASSIVEDEPEQLHRESTESLPRQPLEELPHAENKLDLSSSRESTDSLDVKLPMKRANSNLIAPRSTRRRTTVRRAVARQS